jgi:hypothetical protein
MLRIGSIVLGVSDVPRAAAFWMDALGTYDKADWTAPLDGPKSPLAVGSLVAVSLVTTWHLRMGGRRAPRAIG